MNSDPLISVVMPVYNCAPYIEEAIESILDQTFYDFELIIIDDASTDGTRNSIKKYTDPRIKIVHKTVNCGVSSATNDGFRLAKGKYIARMDGDDISVKDRFEKQVAILENNPDIFVCSGWIQYIGLWDGVIKYKEKHSEIITQLLVSCSICMGSSMFRRKELSGYFYNENKSSGEDYDFWTRVAWLGKMYNIQEVLLLYRIHPQQASQVHKQQQQIDDIRIKLYLFKKLNYDTTLYTDGLISKIFMMNQPISMSEFTLFLQWIKAIALENQKTLLYPQKEFEDVLDSIKKAFLFSLYFKDTALGITKNWRIRALFKLSVQDALYVLRLKSREIIK